MHQNASTLSHPAKDRVTLNNGVEMPLLGFGVFKAEEGREVENAIHWAIEAGYRSIDTAMIYNNEAGVGRAVRDCGLPREELFLTTKLWNSDHGHDQALKAFNASMARLGLDYLDLYLIHWPVARKEHYRDSWAALEELLESGRVRAIGISNFNVHHMETLLETARVVPMVNQMEYHPWLQIPEVARFCLDHQIQLEAWSPIMRGRVNEVPELGAIGKKYGKSPAQVTLRWMLQQGVVTIPKSVREERIRENADLYDFALDADDMAAIDALDRNERLGPDPENFTF